MFETGPIIWLQSYRSEALTILMVVFTATGSMAFQHLMVSIVIFGIDLRRGVVLANMALLTSLLTGVLKNWFAMLRPYQVDPRVVLLDRRFTGEGGSRTVATINRLIRATPSASSYGFPSGHAGSAAALWCGLAVLFQNRILKLCALPSIILVCVTRMYLGHHFLADVVGGAALGTVTMLVSYLILVRQNANLTVVNTAEEKPLPSATIKTFLILAPIALVFLVPAHRIEDAGRLFGINFAFLLLSAKGLPPEPVSRRTRVLRVLVGVALMLLLRIAVSLAADLGLWPSNPWFTFLQGILLGLVFLWGGVSLCRSFGLCAIPKSHQPVDPSAAASR